VIALMFATAWILIGAGANVRLSLLALACALIVWRTRVHLLGLIAAGAMLGALGWV